MAEEKKSGVRNISPFRVDGWNNFVAGIGGTMDKRKETQPGSFVRLTDIELSSAYLGDGFSRNIVDMPADDMTREWIKIENDPESVILNKLQDLRAETAFNEALKWARLYRGGFIMIGAMDGKEVDEPLVLRKGQDIEYLYVGDAAMINLGQCEVDNDTKSKMFGKVLRYSITFQPRAGVSSSQTKMVHHSRILPFFGDPAPRHGATIDMETRFWGTSALQSAWDRLADYDGITASVANLMYELIISIYKFEGLGRLLSQKGGEGSLQNRVEIINLTKSIINGVILDANEGYERNVASLTGIPEIIDRFMMALSGVSRIPVTRLFGRSPAGMNSTGQSDMDTYYDSIKANQKNDLQPQLQTLVDLLATAYGVAGDDHAIKFNPLTQVSPKEKAETNKLDAEAFKTLTDGLNTMLTGGVIDAPTFEKLLKAATFMTNPEISGLLEE